MDNIAASRSLAVTGVRFEFFGKAAHAEQIGGAGDA